MRTDHIVISGTGRSGTSFLVHLFTELCMDTGFKPGQIKLHSISRAGLEHDMRAAGRLPYIIKDPRFCNYADEIFTSNKFKIEYVIIPVRDLKAAADSRRNIHEINKPDPIHGGCLFNTDEPCLQEAALAIAQYKLIESCVRSRTPMLFLSYPKMLQDKYYLYEELCRGIINRFMVPFDTFSGVIDKIINYNWIH